MGIIGNNLLEVVFWLVTASVAMFRYAILLFREHGPFSIFDYVRFYAGVRVVNDVDENGCVFQRRVAEGQLGELFNCPHCLSFWIASVMLALIIIKWLPGLIIVLLGAIWGVAYIIINFLD